MTGIPPVPRTPTRSAGPIGIWALPLVTLGFVVGVMPALVLVVVFVLFAAIGLVTGGLGAAAIVGFLTALVGGGAVAAQPWFVIAPVVIGVAAFVGGVVGSVAALRRLGHPAPRAVTWSAVGLGLVVQLLVNGVVYFVVTLVFAATVEGGIGLVFFGGAPVPLTIFVLCALLVTGGLGRLAWSLFGRVFAVPQRPHAEAGASMTS
ncbi:hypothetical protein [Agromyces italicus]|uniref:hypothetical protein n=1 Tax=Agromyces italicus TaxID=279572 RepID=UPI0003B63479|nr:hypothetical protein [Agromyces italicus]